MAAYTSKIVDVILRNFKREVLKNKTPLKIHNGKPTFLVKYLYIFFIKKII